MCGTRVRSPEVVRDCGFSELSRNVSPGRPGFDPVDTFSSFPVVLNLSDSNSGPW